MHCGCGVAGGNPYGCPADAGPGEGGDCPNGGFGYGPRAEDFPFRNIVTTTWRVGDIVGVGVGSPVETRMAAQRTQGPGKVAIVQEEGMDTDPGPRTFHSGTL